MDIVIPTISGPTLAEIATGAMASGTCTHIDAAVAYALEADQVFVELLAQSSTPFRVYCRADGASVSFLERLLLLSTGRASTIGLIARRFHAKVIWWRGYGAYVGSANLTRAAWEENVEVGIFQREEDLHRFGTADALERMFIRVAQNSQALDAKTLESLAQLERQRQAGAASAHAFQEQCARALMDRPVDVRFSIRWHNSGKGYRQYRIWCTDARSLMDLGSVLPGLSEAMAKGTAFTRDLVVHVSGEKSSQMRVTCIPTRNEWVINANRGTPLGNFARRWDAGGQPGISLPAKYTVHDARDEVQFELPQLPARIATP